MWEGKVFATADADADADAAETDWKHKVTPELGDLIMYVLEWQNDSVLMRGLFLVFISRVAKQQGK